MHFSFDSINELHQFIEWARSLGSAAIDPVSPDKSTSDVWPTFGESSRMPVAAADVRAGEFVVQLAKKVALVTTGAEQEFETTPLTDEAGDLYAPGAAPASADVPADASPAPSPEKRKRRTKAEMEAARAAGDIDAVPPPVTAPIVLTQSLPPATLSAAALNPFSGAASAPATNTVNLDTVINLREAAAQHAPVSQLDHLNACREFIAKHGLPKYNEGFALLGLPVNIMGYSDADRVLHMTTLESLA